MKGLELVLSVSMILIALVSPGDAQQGAQVARIGYLGFNVAGAPGYQEAFEEGLRALGYVQGRNLMIEYRDAEAKGERLPALAAELVALKVNVLVAGGGTLGALAAQQATRTLPIVFTAVGDPVAEGVVSSISRPGGNITGLSTVVPDLVGKLLELLKPAFPRVNRVALLLKPDTMPEHAKKDRLEAAAVAAKALGVRLQVVEARGPGDFDRAFSDMAKARAQALIVLGTPVFTAERRRLADLAITNRLPTVYTFRDYVDAGGLMSYGPDYVDLTRRAATYVDKILKGSPPGDLPVEQPTKFELVINLKTAKALGLTMPPSMLARADQIIER